MDQSLIFILLIALMVGMLFVSSRQRRKQQAQAQTLQSSLVVGDVVVMTSGISGTIVDVDDERTIDLEIAPDVVTTWLRAAVREKLSPEADAPEYIPEHVGGGAEHHEVAPVDRTEVVDHEQVTDRDADGAVSANGTTPGEHGVGSGSSTESRRS